MKINITGLVDDYSAVFPNADAADRFQAAVLDGQGPITEDVVSSLAWLYGAKVTVLPKEREYLACELNDLPPPEERPLKVRP